ATANIGDSFKFEDDGPVVVADGVVPMVVVDETSLSDDASVSFADVFSSAFGADGPLGGLVSETLNIQNIPGRNPEVTEPQVVSTQNSTDRFAAFIDADGSGHWDTGETREDLLQFGNGNRATTIDAAGGLVDMSATANGDPGGINGNQFFVGVPRNGGNGQPDLGQAGHINGTDTIRFDLQSDREGHSGQITIRGPVGSNPQSGPLADIAAGTTFEVRLLSGGSVIETLSYTVDSAQQAFTTVFADDAGQRFDAVEIAAVGQGAFTLDAIQVFSGATSYALGVQADGVDSGVMDTATGDQVFLFLENGQVVGRHGSDSSDAQANGAVVFAISVDGTGTVTLDQQRAVVHDNPADDDESTEPTVLSAAALITLTATITDGDGDTSSATANIGDSFKFEDDGPVVGTPGSVTVNEAGTTSVSATNQSFTFDLDGTTYSFDIAAGSGDLFVSGGSLPGPTLSTYDLLVDLAGGTVRASGNFSIDDPNPFITQPPITPIANGQFAGQFQVSVGGLNTGGNYQARFIDQADAEAFAVFAQELENRG
ncbi:MAG: DUF5801 repeats-in-toxin domain-containing protein, partial [Pseudomonadota bacterium]